MGLGEAAKANQDAIAAMHSAPNSCGQLVASKEIFFAATGITDGTLLSGVHYHGSQAETESLIIRGATGTRRFIRSEHWIG